jgi:hypothetical protein
MTCQQILPATLKQRPPDPRLRIDPFATDRQHDVEQREPFEILRRPQIEHLVEQLGRVP